MINIGINGLGRIGKCIFIQCIFDENINVCAINMPSISIENIKTYFIYDSNHKYDMSNVTFNIIDNNTFSVNDKIIHLFRSRDPKQINWKDYNIDCVIDSTGVFLTKEKLSNHNVNKVILCSPPKDDIPQYVVNVNNELYKGESIVSNASCTTNCISPVLKVLDDTYGIVKGNFTTIHSITASQHTVDSTRYNYRTCRSIIDNIIPHKTGASKSISKLLPQLEGKLYGTSLRIPVSNVSIVDLNIQLHKKTTLKEILEEFSKHDFLQVNNNKFLVSGDFKTTTCPSIIDANASLELHDNEYKLMIWYDNEWSYSNKVIKLLKYIYK